MADNADRHRRSDHARGTGANQARSVRVRVAVRRRPFLAWSELDRSRFRFSRGDAALARVHRRRPAVTVSGDLHRRCCSAGRQRARVGSDRPGELYCCLRCCLDPDRISARDLVHRLCMESACRHCGRASSCSVRPVDWYLWAFRRARSGCRVALVVRRLRARRNNRQARA